MDGETIGCEEVWEGWLCRAIARVELAARKAGSDRLRDFGAWLMAALEAGPWVEAPEVWDRGEDSGRIRLHWVRGRKHVSIELDALDRAEIQLWTGDALVSSEVYTVGHIEHVRCALGWIFPEANASHEGW